MSTEVSKTSYGNYSSSNYGAHCMAIKVGSLTLWFSYDTVVAFRSPKNGFCITKNYWGPTTGKHLNWIHPNKDIRLDGEDFDTRLKEALAYHRLEV